MEKNIRRLPDSEWEVMQAVWACTPPVSRLDMEPYLKNDPPMALTTLLTLLSRLEEKGFLKIEKMGRSSRYIPLIGQQEYLASQSKRFFEKFCGGNASVFANALCDSGLSKEELSQIRSLLERELL